MLKGNDQSGEWPTKTTLREALLTALLRAGYRLAAVGPSSKRRRITAPLTRWRLSVYPPGGRMLRLARLDDHLTLWVNACEQAGGDLYLGVGFEPVESGLVKHMLIKGDAVFDVGANIGMYTVCAAREVGSQGHVHTFEPGAETFEILQRNVRTNAVTNATLNRLAVGRAAGQVELLVNRESALSSLGATGRGEVLRREQVTQVSLDDYAAKHGVAVLGFLKIDVEGYEGHVLEGARRLLQSSPNLGILCELAEKNFKPLNLSVEKVLDDLLSLGYAAWEIDADARCLIRLQAGKDRHGNQNFVFVRPGTVRAERLAVAAKAMRLSMHG